MTTYLTQLREALAEVEDLHHAGALLGWDQHTKMPPKGAAGRAEAIATVEKIGHQKFVDPSLGKLLEGAAGEVEGLDPDSDDVALVKQTQRTWDKARLVPTELAADLARAASLGQDAWVEARANNDFKAFVPYLERTLELKRAYVDCFDSFDCAYDALLDDYEPGMKTAEVTRLFAELRDELVPLIAEVAKHTVDDSPLHHKIPIDKQRALVLEVVERMGFNNAGWRLDDTTHPFAESMSSSDVRITNRWEENYFASSLYGGMHECGHGLYEEGVADALQRTPLGHGVSLGFHESQSRMWENMVGRGRPFANTLAPTVSRLFGGELTDITPERFFRAVNRIKPSLIRVEADEATYSLHVILRFELEQELIEGRLGANDLRDAWNSRMSDYLGIDVPSDTLGVLQDVHWSAGLVGYFPTYALGNLIGGQLWAKVHEDIPELDELIGAGELSPLREWLRENVHRHGAKFLTPQLLERIVGSPIEVGPFVDYLKTKLSSVYEVSLA
jgi:carboxypeptidase Taq